MALSRLGDYIELIDNRNSDLKYDINDVKGISTSKCFIESKANLDNVPLHNYKIVGMNEFAYVADTSRRGDKIGLALQDEDPCIISSIYTTFKVKKENELDPYYLLMYFRRPEFDRYARFNSWGSAREVFSWESFCDTRILIPPIEIQRKYVAIYKAMQHNLKVYQNNLNDIKLVNQAIFQKIKNDNETEIGKLIKIDNTKNNNNEIGIESLRGINEKCDFVPTRDSITKEKINKYLIIRPNSFGINFMCLGNFGKFYLAYNDSNDNYIISPACQSFHVVSNAVDEYYLMYVLRREEFQRKCVFLGDGNTRGGINFNDFEIIKIPIPSLKTQRIIGDLYRAYESRRMIADKLNERINAICPILISGAIKESEKLA